jgi:surface protein
MYNSSLTTLDVSGWDVSNITSFSWFAHNCTSLTTLDVSGWDVSSVTNFSTFVTGCSNLTTLNISNWDTSNVTNFSSFASSCTALTDIGNLCNLDFSSVTNTQTMLRYNPNLTTYMPADLFWNNSNITNYSDTFTNDTNIDNYCEIPSSWGGDDNVNCGTAGIPDPCAGTNGTSGA